MYTIKVIEIGSYVEELLNEKMMVLFGPTAPVELRDICVVHDGVPVDGDVLTRGGAITIGNQKYVIEEFGEAANENMGGLGHLTIVFDATKELLPGSVLVSPEMLPVVEVGTDISFESQCRLASTGK